MEKQWGWRWSWQGQPVEITYSPKAPDTPLSILACFIVLNEIQAMQIITGIHGSSFWSRGAFVRSHGTGDHGTWLERSGLAAAKDCKGSSMTRDVQTLGEMWVPLWILTADKKGGSPRKQTEQQNRIWSCTAQEKQFTQLQLGPQGQVPNWPCSGEYGRLESSL